MKKVIIMMCIVATLTTGTIVYNLSNDNKKSSQDLDTPLQDKNVATNEKRIFSIMETENSWAFDVSNTKEIFNDADYVVKVKVLGMENGTFEYSASDIPVTPISVEMLEVIKGNVSKPITKILQYGGYVTVKQVMEVSLDSRNEKMGLNKLTDEEQKSQYIYYAPDGNYDLEVGKTYVVALSSKNNQGNYFLASNGYAIFETDNDTIVPFSNNESPIYKNVLTGNRLVIE